MAQPFALTLRLLVIATWKRAGRLTAIRPHSFWRHDGFWRHDSASPTWRGNPPQPERPCYLERAWWCFISGYQNCWVCSSCCATIS